MTLSDIASIGTLVSGIAVLVSLVYLNVQTRQTVRNQQSLMQLGRSQQLIDWLQYIAEADTNELVIRGNDGNLNAIEFVRYNSVAWSMLIAYENNFLQHRAGMLDDDQFAASVGSLKFQCSLPGFRANWAGIRHMFASEFKTYVDGIIRETPILTNVAEKSHAIWKGRAARDIAGPSGHANENETPG